MRTILTAIVLIASPVPALAQATPQTAAEAPIVAEARAFMAAYAEDLRHGDSDAIVARYDRRGVYFPMDAVPFQSFAAVGALYRGEDWTGPKSFEWQSLAYEPLSPDAVMVTGSFLWGRETGEISPFGYTGLLIRQNGVLRIRLEHESPLTPSP